MSHIIRSSFDRRSGVDRREVYTVGYFLEGGMERRSGKERRWMEERRKGWVRASLWSSVCVKLFVPKHPSVSRRDNM